MHWEKRCRRSKRRWWRFAAKDNFAEKKNKRMRCNHEESTTTATVAIARLYQCRRRGTIIPFNCAYSISSNVLDALPIDDMRCERVLRQAHAKNYFLISISTFFLAGAMHCADPFHSVSRLQLGVSVDTTCRLSDSI